MSAHAFNRKYRSQTFADLVGQEHVATTLRNAVRTGRVAHAYLFCGPRGVGKTSAARILAKAVNCPNARDGEPCAVCSTCLAIQEGRAIDVFEADAASNRGIEDIRDIRERVGFAPAELRYKFYILDEAHMLTTEAFNALLKTLEEPPPHAIFVLVTTDPQKLPETVASRCQRLDFRRISVGAAVGRLRYVCEQEGIVPGEGLLEALAHAGGGSLRDAEGALDQVVAFAGKEPTVRDAQRILGLIGVEAALQILDNLQNGGTAAAIIAANSLIDRGADPRQIALAVVDLLRSAMLARVGGDRVDDLLNVMDLDRARVKELASTFASPQQIIELIRVFTPGPATRGNLRPQLPLEISIVEAEQVLQTRREQPPASPVPRPVAPARPEPRPVAPPAAAMPRVDSAPPARPPEPELVGSEDDTARSAPDLVVANGSPSSEAATPAPDGVVPTAVPGGPLFSEARLRWNEIIETCGARNRSVQALLRSAGPIGSEDSTLVLGFPYDFHRDRIEDPRNRAVVEEIIGQVLGRKIRVRCSKTTKEALAAGDPLQAALEDPLVRQAISLGARVRSVTEDSERAE